MDTSFFNHTSETVPQQFTVTVFSGDQVVFTIDEEGVNTIEVRPRHRAGSKQVRFIRVVINDDVYSDLSQDHQQAIMEAAKESTEYQIKLWHQAVEDEKKIAIEKHNVKFNEVDKEPFREAVQPIHKQFSENPMFKNLYYQIRDNSDE